MSAHTRWPAVVSVMLGIFVIVTTEILPIGLLTPIGATFGISPGTAGLMMTMPGFLAAVAAPLVTSATARLDRRRLLGALILVLALANFLAALAPGYWLMLISRVLVGVVIGGFWSVGAGLAPRLVPAPRVGLATAVIFAAVPLGSVLGVPAGTWLGGLAGWRAVFVVMGVLTAGVFLALLVFLPPLPPARATGFRLLADLLRRPSVRAGLTVTFLVVLAHFGTYTYLTTFLREVTDASPTPYLLVYGLAGVAGNFLAGRWAGARTRETFAVAAGLIALATLLLPVSGDWAPALLVLWGLGYGAVPACAQTWLVRSAPHAPEAATVLFTASFQATLSAGALLGGVVVDASSVSVALVAGGVVAVLALGALQALPQVRQPVQHHA
ncbi:MFS transporter [Crossiella sp. CA198]|uniref:MFS transporter n=1 Tax=Crossiella sp. CA198 TaxID=3455607 RepID=UPI003F8D58F0